MKSSHLDMVIEALRQQMVEKAMDKNNFTDEEVLRLSQKLDHYLVKSQRRKLLLRKLGGIRTISTRVL